MGGVVGVGSSGRGHRPGRGFHGPRNLGGAGAVKGSKRALSRGAASPPPLHPVLPLLLCAEIPGRLRHCGQTGLVSQWGGSQGAGWRWGHLSPRLPRPRRDLWFPRPPRMPHLARSFSWLFPQARSCVSRIPATRTSRGLTAGAVCRPATSALPRLGRGAWSGMPGVTSPA